MLKLVAIAKYKMLSPKIFSGGLVLGLTLLPGCNDSASSQTALSSPSSQVSQAADADSAASADLAAGILWASDFSGADWLESWQPQSRGTWGLDNFEVVQTPDDRFEQVLRVHYPAHSASPAVARSHHVPIGGGEFRGDLGLAPQTALRLSYYVRFSEDFDFVKGGKLPGLFGGAANSGGHIPNGRDGFSTRFMWRQNGEGEVYAYLPTSETWGTSIGQGNWRFTPGQWHHLEQEIRLNQPDQSDGQIRVWFDGQLVVDRQDMTFRSVDTLTIDGIFFSSFFGGGDPSWATPRSVYADFADFSVAAVD